MLTWVRTEETTEGPVPAGLGNLTAPQRALAELFGLSDALITAAAEGNSGQSVQEDPGGLQARWLQSLPQATKDRQYRGRRRRGIGSSRHSEVANRTRLPFP